MALTVDQQQWVDRLTGKTTPLPDPSGLRPDQVREEFLLRREREEIAEQARKEQYIEKMLTALEGEKTNMQKAFRMQLELEGKAISTMGEGGDQTKALDKEEVSKVTKGPGGGEMVTATKMMDIIVNQKRILESATARRSKIKRNKIVMVDEPLFSEDEIGTELYEPLVRELVLPENFVPNKMSKTQKMLEGSNDCYLEELKEVAEENGAAENLETAGKIIDISKSIVKLIPEQGDTAKLLGDLGFGMAEMMVGAGAAIVKRQGSGGVATLVGNVSDIVSTVVGAATGNEDLGEIVALSMKGAIGGTISVLGPLLEKDPPDVNGALTALGDMIKTGFEIGAVGKEDKDVVATLAKIGAAVKGTFESIAKAREEKLIDAVKAGNWAEAGTVLVQCAGIACKQAMGAVRDVQKVGLDDDESEEIDEEGEEQDEGVDEAVEGIEGLKDFKVESEETREKIDKDKEERKEEQSKNVAKQLEEEQSEFTASLDQLGKPEPDLKSIAVLMEKMKKDAAIMSAVVAVGSGGFKAAAFFFEPLKAGGTLVNFLANLAAATQRAIDMRKWIDARAEATAAVSPYLTSIKNFVTNQKEQFSHYTIKMALNVLQFGAQIAATAVPFAKVISAGADIAESMQDLVYKFYNERAVKTAWNVTKQALDNPENRKLGLIARRQNPTLAKYSIAWGAIIARDTIAISALNRCGLDRETLSQKDSNVNAVKEYLELLYKDDRVVKEEYKSGDWRKNLPAPTLEVRVWIQTYTTAATSLTLKTPNPGNVVTLLKQIENFAKTESALTEDQFDDYIRALQELADFLDEFQPTTEAGQADAGLAKIIAAFVELAEVELARVNEAKLLKYAVQVGNA